MLEIGAGLKFKYRYLMNYTRRMCKVKGSKVKQVRSQKSVLGKYKILIFIVFDNT